MRSTMNLAISIIGRMERPAFCRAQRRQIVSDVGSLPQAGEMKSYIDLLFLALIVLLCISKIVTN
jgi:hypothetical protein